MNPDQDSNPLLDDLLQGDHGALRAVSLNRMLAEGHRARLTKRNIRLVGVVAALLAVAGVAWLTPRAARDDVLITTKPSDLRVPNEITARQLSDAELKKRLEKFAIAYVGKATDKRIVMIEPTGL